MPAECGQKTGVYEGFSQQWAALSCRGEFSLQMKTTASDGMILYMADDRQVDFVALYLKAGLLVYAFNCGSSPVVIRSGAGYNDGQWHSVRLHFSLHATTSEVVIPPKNKLHNSKINVIYIIRFNVTTRYISYFVNNIQLCPEPVNYLCISLRNRN